MYINVIIHDKIDGGHYCRKYLTKLIFRIVVSEKILESMGACLGRPLGNRRGSDAPHCKFNSSICKWVSVI